jgi:hypothetical protein
VAAEVAMVADAVEEAFMVADVDIMVMAVVDIMVADMDMAEVGAGA